MTCIRQHTLNFTPLSPIHIGADESYEPGNYVIDVESGALYSFDHHAAIAGLEETDKKQLLAIVNGKPDDSMLTGVQAFFHDRQDKLIAYANTPIPTTAGITELYNKRIGKTAQHENRGKKVINRLEIERTAYNPATNQPILPGSSIKGAIRTALLDHINQGRNTQHREKSRDLQQRLLEGMFATDPFRLVGVSDAVWLEEKDMPAFQVKFAVNRKRQPVKDRNGNLLKSRAESRNLNQLLECVPQYSAPRFKGTIQFQRVNDLPHDSKKLPAEKFQWQLLEIAKACNAFYFELFKRELTALKERNYVQQSWALQMEQLMEEVLRDGETFLLRIGRHSGAEAVTLNGARNGNIKIMQGKGNKPSFEDKPKTWWLAAENSADKTQLLPFGWMLVEIGQAHSSKKRSTEQDELKTWFQQQLTKQDRLKKQSVQRQEIAEQKRQQQKEKEREEREQADAERRRIDSLSPFEKELEEFLKTVQPQEHDTGLLRELEAGRWQGEEAARVAEMVKQLMQEQGKWIPDFTGSNKKKMKFKERSLAILKFLEWKNDD